MNNKALISIVMPVYNGETTLNQVFEGLEKQTDKDLVEEIIIINDFSKDQSEEVIRTYKEKSSYKIKNISHDKSHGLAAGYNEGVTIANTKYVLLMHQDIVLKEINSIRKMLEPFKKPEIVATYPVLLHPYEVWKNYNFWQKALFSRFVDKKLPMLTGKFDCFSRSFLEEVGFFDNKTYRTAGEDSDLKIKIQRAGLKAVNSEVEVIHLQYAEKDFSVTKLIKKEAQIAEAQGVILRKYGLHDFKGVALSFFRQILLLGLLVPMVNVIFAILILIYTFTYTKLVFLKDYTNPRIFVLPILNVFLLFVAFYYSTLGFLTAKQKL